MTTLTTIHSGHDVAYFTNGHATGGCSGAMSYYTASGEPPGQWAGKGSATLGLSGEVDPQVIADLYMRSMGPGGELLRHRRKAAAPLTVDEVAEGAEAACREAHPFASEIEIAEAVSVAVSKTGQVKVPYFDLMISAVKSVSVLHASLRVAAGKARAAGQAEFADELEAEAEGIEADMMDSARAAVRKAEETAGYVRTGHHSATSGEWRDAEGLTAALFPHHISRDGDPQLHVHVAIANLARRDDCGDDKWRGLYGRALYDQRLAIAAQVDREMESRLIARGYAMVKRADGNGAEVAGVSDDVMDLFSSRSRHLTPELAKLIEQYVQTYGKQPSKRTIWLLGQQAAQNTRRTKAQARRRAGGQDTGEDLDEAGRFKAWEEQTTREETDALTSVHMRVREASAAAADPVSLTDYERARCARIAVAEVQKHHAVFSMSELSFEVNRALPVGASPADIAATCKFAVSGVTGADVIEVTAPDVVDPRELGVRRDGTSVYRPPNEGRYTTSGQLDLEETIIRLASKKVTPRVSKDEAEKALDGSGLTGEQLAAVVALLTTDQAVTILTAAAGAGKTFAVAAFAKAWIQLTGRRVIGLATSENAARVMAAEGVPETYNTAAFLGKTKGSDLLRYPVSLGQGDVLVLDESSQLSTSDLALIEQYADRSGATIIPTGDMMQLGAVEAGGMVRLLAERLGYVELTEVLRFRADWERDASLRLRAGDKSVLAAYDTRGRIRGCGREAAYEGAVSAWLADHLRGKDVLLLAGSNAEASDLASRAQARLITLGAVQTPCADLSDGNRAGPGDLIRARLNARINAGGRRLVNRDVLLVDAVSDSAVQARRKLPDGSWSARFDIPLEYLAESAELSYAGNVHVSQGRTVDTSHVVATETLSRESLYVSMTRGREANTAWTVTGESAPEGKPAYTQAAPESVLADIMERSSAELSATEQIEQAQEWAGGTGHVLNLWSASVKETASKTVAEQLRGFLSETEFARYENEPQRQVLHQALRERELAGADLRSVIEGITSDSLDGARSVSAVLHGRLTATPIEWVRGTWAARTPANAPELAKEAAAVLDDRQTALGQRLLEAPEPWIVAQIGMPPTADASPALRDDWADRAARGAAYREAAGITDPGQAVSAAGHANQPELEAMRRDVIRALEIQDNDALIRQASRGQLEAKISDGERVRAVAPAEVSSRLKLAAQAETDMRAQAVRARLEGDAAAAEGTDKVAEVLAGEKASLEESHYAYEDWSERTAETRAEADRAAAELDRRGADLDEHIEQIVSASEGREPQTRETREAEQTARVDAILDKPQPQAPEMEPEAESEAEADSEASV